MLPNPRGAGGAPTIRSWKMAPRLPWPTVVTFGAMTSAEVRGILERAGYTPARRQKGSHIRLEAEGRQSLTLALGSKELSPGLVRKILMKDAGLTEDEIEELR